MTNAVIISLVLHLMLFAYLLVGEKRSHQDAYPKIMNVDLISLPPISRGTPSGAETPKQQTEAVKPKAQTKVETKPTTPRVAEVDKRKRQESKKPEPKPETQAEKADNEKDERYGLPEGLETGSEFGTVRLDGASFETPTYLNILFAKIKNRWDNPYLGGEKTSCTIYFTILQNGGVVDAIVERSSGIPAFDQSALRAVMSSKPPPLPLEYTGNQLGIHLDFQYIP